VNLPVRRVPFKSREGVELEINKMLEHGVIERSQAEWCTPVVPVAKPDGSVWICIDYRGLNAVTPQRRYYLPTLDDLLDRAGQCSIMSTLDLTSGFHQIEMEEEYKDLTTFGSPQGKFRFCRMPFGLKNAPAIFQCVVEHVLRNCKDIAANYVDDVLVYTRDWDSHLKALRSVLFCLGEAGFSVKLRKCVFGKGRVKYLGHLVGGGRLAIPSDRVEALARYEKPKTKRSLKSFLGAIGYYRRFVDKFADLSACLTVATSKDAPVRVLWTEDMERAFVALRKSLCRVTCLNVPVCGDIFVLHTDASGVAIAGCLHVNRIGEELPVAYYSRQLRDAERRY